MDRDDFRDGFRDGFRDEINGRAGTEWLERRYNFPAEHQARVRHPMRTGELRRQPLVTPGEPAEPGGPREAPLDHPPPGQQDEPRFVSVCLTTPSRMPCAAASAAGWSPVYPWPTYASSAARA